MASPRLSIGFNKAGFYTTYPTVFSSVNADALDPLNQGPTGVLAIVGPGAGFIPPKTAYSMPIDSRVPSAVLAASDLMTACEIALRPFPQLDRAFAQMLVVPVTAATAATKTLLAGATLLATLTTKVYGLKANSVTVRSETGKLTITLPGANSNPIIETYTYSTVAALVAEINARSGIVTAAFTATGTPDNFAATAMTGGTEPSITPTDWADAFAALNGYRPNCIMAATSDPAVHAMLSDYCIQRRSRGFFGGVLQNWNGIGARQTAIAALKAASAALNAPRMMNVGLGADGYAAYLAAARYAALAATLEPSVPMTQKLLNFESLETRLDIATEVGGVGGLLLGGVAAPVPDPQNPATFIVSRGVSTWTTDANLYRTEHSVLAAVDGIQTEIERQVAGLLGGEGTIGALTRAKTRVESVLKEATKPTSAIRILSYRPESIGVSFSSVTVMRIVAALTPIVPINFIDVNLRLERTEIEIGFDVPLTGA